MNLQFISDGAGKEIDLEEIGIPDWQKDIVRQRLTDYKENPDQVLDFDIVMDDIDNTL